MQLKVCKTPVMLSQRVIDGEPKNFMLNAKCGKPVYLRICDEVYDALTVERVGKHNRRQLRSGPTERGEEFQRTRKMCRGHDDGEIMPCKQFTRLCHRSGRSDLIIRAEIRRNFSTALRWFIQHKHLGRNRSTWNS